MADEAIDAEIAKLTAELERIEKNPAARFFGWTPLHHQVAWLDAWQESNVHTIVLTAGNQVGKCRKFSSKITTLGGERVPVGDLIGCDFAVPTLDSAGRCVGAVARAELNALEPVFRVRTKLGFELEVNAQHPLWATFPKMGKNIDPEIPPGDWVPVSKLKPGALVAIASHVKTRPVAQMADHEAKLLAYMIADGGLTSGAAAISKRADSQHIDDLAEVAKGFGCNLRKSQRADAQMVHMRLVGNDGRNNPVLDFLRKHGLLGLGAGHKFIPQVVFESPKSAQALFLSRLFGCDGWLYVRKNGVVELGYSTISERLARDVHNLLLRFGIQATFSSRPVKGRPSGYRHYSVTSRQADQVERFLEEVGLFGKAGATFDARCSMAGKTRRIKWRHLNARPGTVWDKVVSVERLPGLHWTVAIEVPDGHTYLDEFYEHNSQVGAIATISECTGMRPLSLGGIVPKGGRWPVGNRKGFKAFIGVEAIKTSFRENLWPVLDSLIDKGWVKRIKTNSQTGVVERIWWRSGAELSVGSYEQDVSMHEGGVWDWIWFDEPPPLKLYTAMERGTIARGGRMLITATPLKEAWMLDTLILPAFDQDSPTFGRVKAFECSIWENAKSKGGVLPDESIAAFLAKLPPKEREAREHGRFTHLIGLEFNEFTADTHIVADIY